ncbi:tRNA (adenosine(37)-N6)-threonylcarbamoyltransferase complex transferase subunit TsaD [Corynebacterium sp. TAE3-ERU12]|uniref:tRNA (adenosine(37)-N6)-threonylcarbamoyltransferase complex transferase subunit TsaD n=1 Tax=Corynebacterium sp. TAE3-ERU12 TaxID=2849491 RepID=UPI001C466725|nr:tRNA (adenosine(37)-N6)-threonylcarbamoyltransferase complex transferase subunit TsaD [Corynebacterium sp. TAE3-ERU12]MBV7294723.1 tRNA (adenosine(37)-N6)-threonylcarbamoyltransferase complex transferase subunit TsaD [Corynebacterium sp. TAE3-ERU12]
MNILGIESSCDETGAAVVRVTYRTDLPDGDPAPTIELLSDVVHSSMSEHARFGGVVPEIASRAHLEALQPVVRATLADAGIDAPDAVAATVGPGLAGALLVGAAGAKAYAAAWDVPFYGVNHLGGHVAVDALASGADLTNAVALLVSGGHTQLLRVRGIGRPMSELGSTLDDAAGEAYDKVARLLGLGYPGGPVIDKLAKKGDPAAIALPRGMMRQQDSRHDFSFSGLKTAVARVVEAAEREGRTIDIADLCASFQEAVCDVLTFKAVRAATDVGATVVLLGGGVAANSRLRELAAERCAKAGLSLHVPPARLCTDNGVMIATLAAHLIAAGGQPSGYGCGTDPGLPVEIPLVAKDEPAA